MRTMWKYWTYYYHCTTAIGKRTNLVRSTIKFIQYHARHKDSYINLLLLMWSFIAQGFLYKLLFNLECYKLVGWLSHISNHCIKIYIFFNSDWLVNCVIEETTTDYFYQLSNRNLILMEISFCANIRFHLSLLNHCSN